MPQQAFAGRTNWQMWPISVKHFAQHVERFHIGITRHMQAVEIDQQAQQAETLLARKTEMAHVAEVHTHEMR